MSNRKIKPGQGFRLAGNGIRPVFQDGLALEDKLSKCLWK